MLFAGAVTGSAGLSVFGSGRDGLRLVDRVTGLGWGKVAVPNHVAVMP